MLHTENSAVFVPTNDNVNRFIRILLLNRFEILGTCFIMESCIFDYFFNGMLYIEIQRHIIDNGGFFSRFLHVLKVLASIEQ